MGTVISAEAAEAALSILTGVAAGILYDLLRVLRRRAGSRAFTAATDVIFCAVCAFALFALGLSAGGGEQRLYIAALAVCGAAVYFATASRIILRAGLWITDKLARLTRLLLAPAAAAGKFLRKKLSFLKKPFSKAKKWYTIKRQHGKKPSAGAPAGEESIYAPETHRYTYEGGAADTAGVRHCVAYDAPWEDRGREA